MNFEMNGETTRAHELYSSTRELLLKVWGSYGGAYEECRLLGSTLPVHSTPRASIASYC
jgi:hypothetical protein